MFRYFVLRIGFKCQRQKVSYCRKIGSRIGRPLAGEVSDHFHIINDIITPSGQLYLDFCSFKKYVVLPFFNNFLIRWFCLFCMIYVSQQVCRIWIWPGAILYVKLRCCAPWRVIDGWLASWMHKMQGGIWLVMLLLTASLIELSAIYDFLLLNNEAWWWRSKYLA